MADAAAMSGGEKTPEPSQRVEDSSGLFGVENGAAAAEGDDCTQNGGRSERSRSDESPLLDPAAVENRDSPRSGHRKTAALEQTQAQPLSEGLGSSLLRAPEDLPLKKNFQIPRKSREKKALFQPITNESREFEDIVNILHSSYLDILSKDRFTYKKASLVHSELLEKDFIEKRKELKQDGRSEKELAEAYAFLKVDRSLVQNICENGLLVGHSKIAVLGNPSMGVYLSKYADLLQANPLEANSTGDIIIFKIIKGKMKTIYDKYDNQTVNVMDSAVKNALDPTPKHECHVSKTANKITSSRNYRAYERTQYYFYEYQFHEIRQRPRHVCPYAVVSFLYKDEKMQKYLPQVRSKTSSMDKSTDKASYTLWKGQLLNKGKLVCHAALISEKRPTLPCKLPEKLDVEMVMSFEKLAQKFSSRVLAKETYSGEREVFKNGMYCSLFEVVEKTRSGSNLEGLLQKLETDNLVILKPLVDGGHLLLLSPYQMASPYDNRTGRPRVLQALFLFRKSRNLVTSVPKSDQKNENMMVLDETHEVVPELPRFIQSLHYAYVHSRKDSKSDLNILMERYINDYFKRYSKYKEFVLYQYKGNLDEKTFLYPGPKNKSHLETCLQSYIFGSETYQIPVSKVKKIMDSNRKPQQFSPVSDYEPLEDESDFTRRKAGKRNGSKYENVAAKRKSAHSGDRDRGNIEDLINLIHYKKKTVDRESDSEDNRNESRRKRKCESKRESPQKQLKMSNTLENYEAGFLDDRAPESLLSMIADLGGRDTDLRQQNVADPPITDLTGVLKLLSEVLTNTDFQAAKLIKQASLENYSKQTVEYNPIPPKIKEEPELPNTTHENITHEKFKDPQSPNMLEKSVTCLPNSLDASTIETDPDHILPLKETSTGSISSFDGCVSPCPSTPLEQNYHRQRSNSNNSEATEIHWKLIPITGGVGRVPEDQLRKLGDNIGLKSPDEVFAYSVPKDVCEQDPRVINRQRSSDYEFAYCAFSDIPKDGIEDKIHTNQEVKSEEQCDYETNNYVSSKHSVSGIIETAILEEYNIFTNKIQEILQQKNIVYVSGVSKPVISAQERIMRLSEFICLQASDIAVHTYVERLSEKLNSVASSCSYSVQNVSHTESAGPADNSVTSSGLNLPLEEPVSSSNDFEEHLSEPLCSSVEGEASINEQNQPVLLDIEKDKEKEHKPVNANIEGKLTAEPKGSPGDCLPKSEKISKPVVKSDTTKQPALAGFISQLRPEVFDSIFKIIEDVRKNTLKFYIHEEQESLLCKEIKEYLTKLGNTECHPEQFLRRRGELDKLLVIIQNEDIAHLIHKIPCLVSLKRLPCVSFAGVESLDDVKNRTYNDLFVSGGFIVSDESVLNPESVSVDKLNEFLKFLGELSTPDEKWQWKIHCKIQKKLKELVRTNKNATNLLALLSAYQKKHMVEILAYHSCDSQTRSTPELECLIKLQYQNIQQRHVVFLTEKNVSTFASYADNGIVVTTVSSFMHNFKSLVGCHNLVTEESLPSPTDNEKQTALIENDEKDEEDMSLDSGDEASQIEVCNDASNCDSHLEDFQTETKGPHATDSRQNSQSDALLSSEEQHYSLTEETSKIDMPDIQPVTPVSTTCCAEGERTNSDEQIPLSFQMYNRQLSVPHQFSHFNVLTHQTFLGTTYPMSTSQKQESGNCFLTAYSQNMDMDHSSSSSNNWDTSCDSLRPFPKQN
ncbi:protein TASOR isoform X3 [Notechis scutatus]|uniref:Protein TASOR isoform X3 n=1 Tax=Notechis scutatus TaxID=8663 RepID=A0A6J1V078_9SAUR|nr:protein TASOR isoform X3 [Notechis scutatus]